MKTLPYGKQLIEDDDVEAVTAQLRDDWLTQGPTVGRFEEALCTITGAKYAVAVSSGTAALHLASLVAGVGPGDVGITATNTFVASANGIRYCGGRPHIVDVEPDTGLMSMGALEAAVEQLGAAGKRPRVIIPVDFSGATADLVAVERIARACGAVVIEDAAHSLGTEYQHGGATYRAASCAHTTMAILSFHPVKHLTTAEGGAITTNDPALHARLLELRSHGITRDPAKLTRNDGPWYQEQQSLGYHYRLTDLQCALGVSQARKFPRFVARRRAIAGAYDAAFARAPFASRIAPLRVPAGVSSAYHLYVVRIVAREGESLDGVAARRKAAYLQLREKGILPQVHYVPVHMQPDYQQFVEGQRFPGGDAYYASCLSLPMYPALTDSDVERVIATLGEIASA
ncbi:MAG TPA: UDP-4-amino-4,6-dideoxy-N-acetyl-beta-L-altrosamine transaminase [Labilithrix sp.]|nr:UDP-4-amino-4,6-dideoxy-N-acetyl-beta-L-altrosamine transaminase [Labilithrix sp.]